MEIRRERLEIRECFGCEDEISVTSAVNDTSNLLWSYCLFMVVLPFGHILESTFLISRHIEKYFLSGFRFTSGGEDVE